VETGVRLFAAPLISCHRYTAYQKADRIPIILMTVNGFIILAPFLVSSWGAKENHPAQKEGRRPIPAENRIAYCIRQGMPLSAGKQEDQLPPAPPFPFF
jgi:hypothetical protein